MSAVKTCPECHGRGWVYELKQESDRYLMRDIKCARCRGTGITPRTNKDMIQMFSDEELADLLTDWDFCSDVCSQQYSDNPLVGKCPENCKEQVLEWLRQPVEEDT